MNIRSGTIRLFAWAVLAFCWLFPAVLQAAGENAAYLAALESIQVGQLQQHVEYLASDKLEGREAGQNGGRAAARFLQSQLEKLKLRPAGDHGGYFQPFAANFQNVLGLLPGSDPRLGDEVIVVCAHYDHVGYGDRRNSRGAIGRVHNGADDNASGTAALLELAEAFSILSQPPKRSVLFAFWDAEEKGLLGSKHWASHPTLPRDKVAAVLNMDMVGRLRDDRVTVYGSRSGVGWRRLICQQNESLGLCLQFSWQMRADADHYPFYQRGIPVLMLHTGLHDDYHTPRDDAKLINHPGMQRVARLAFRVTFDLADRHQPPAFRPASRSETEWTRERLSAIHASKLPNRLGVRWQPKRSPGDGLLLTRVFRGLPAEKAGLRPGDRILQFAGRTIRVGDDLRSAVMAAESPASVLLRRPDRTEPHALSVPLDGRPLRLGITWRTDRAEPGTVILARVVAGSPAAHAGLRAGDRIYQIAGHSFVDEAEFARFAKSLPEPLELLVERNGQLHIFVLQLTADLAKRAA